MKCTFAVILAALLAMGCRTSTGTDGSTAKDVEPEAQDGEPSTAPKTVLECESDVDTRLVVREIEGEDGKKRFEGSVKEITSDFAKSLDCVRRTRGERSFMCYTKPSHGTLMTYQPRTTAQRSKVVEVSVVRVDNRRGAELAEYLQTYVTDGDDYTNTMTCEKSHKGF